MNRFVIHYTSNSYEQISRIIKKLNWVVLNPDGTEYVGKLIEGSYITKESNKVKLLNTDFTNLIEININYEFNLSINKNKNLLNFSYKIIEVKTRIDGVDNNTNDDFFKTKEGIGNNYNLISSGISLKKRAGTIIDSKDNSSYEFMVLLQLMKRIDERLDFIENELLSGTSTNSNQEITKNDDKILSVIEVAELLGLAKATIYTKVNRKELPHMKRGKNLYFSEKEINEYLKGGKILSNEEIDEISKKYISNSPNKRINQ
jgi:excisionase family DNA binding protein